MLFIYKFKTDNYIKKVTFADILFKFLIDKNNEKGLVKWIKKIQNSLQYFLSKNYYFVLNVNC